VIVPATSFIPRLLNEVLLEDLGQGVIVSTCRKSLKGPDEDREDKQKQSD
jgi:hypothetical protein